MYRLVRKYYGELCDKEKVDNEEVYDEEHIDCRDLDYLTEVMNKYLTEDIKNGYVVDIEEKNMYRLFSGEQENWNNYIEMYIEEFEKEYTLLEEVDIIAENYYNHYRINKNDLNLCLKSLEDKFGVHYQEILNMVAKVVIKNRIGNFSGLKSIGNKEFISLIRELEEEFDCEIDEIDFSVRFNLQ